MNVHRVSYSLTLLLLLLAAWAPAALAAPTAEHWEEIGGSARGRGISDSVRGVVPEHRNTSILIGPDQRPIVAYTDWADVVVRQWNGAAWAIIGEPGGGHAPQLLMDRNGRMYLGWMSFVADTESWEVYVWARDDLGGEWQELGGSATGGGISGADGRANVNSFSLALGPDGTPWVAYDTTPTAGADFTTHTSGIALQSTQTYVKRWAGPSAGWVYVGSGRDGGGASNASSFTLTNADGSANLALHASLSPAIAIGADGVPIVAFVYTTAFTNGDPPEFNGANDDIYAVRWNGTAWMPMGPAVPGTAAGAGLGAPGGLSNSAGWSVEGYFNRINGPQIMIGRDRAPVLGWGETTSIDDARRMHVRRWNGTAWEGVGSASGGIGTAPLAFDISLAPGLHGPVAAWSSGSGSDSSIFVLGYDARTGRWGEIGRGSATGTGISGPTRRGFTPWITVDAAGTPSVTWIEAPDTDTGGQTFVRTFESRNLPDLTLTALTAPASTRTSGTISVTSTVRNLGASTSPSARVIFYLSTTTARSTADVVLGGRSVGSLGVNGTSTATTSITLPAAVEPGTYYVLAVLDEADAVLERSESNNARASSPMTVTLFRPDLTLSALTVPASGAAGRPLAITTAVRNLGPAPAGAFSVRFFLSTDDTRDAGDVLLGARAITSLGAGRTATAVTTVMLPANTSVPATYRVLGVVDALGQQVELDESNNTLASGPIGVTAYRPDLAMVALASPAAGSPGHALAIANTVRNLGPAPAGGFLVRFLLAVEGAPEGTGVMLGSRTIARLAPGAASSAITRLAIPANVSTPGTYRVVGVVDALGQHAELDESNNVTRAAATVAVTPYQPDLVVTALTVPAAGATGRPLAITNTVGNTGPAPARAFTVRFYLSADATLDAGDVLLGARSVAGLAAGAVSRAVTTLTLPATTAAPASYRVIAVVDGLAQQAETDETNNTLVSSGTVAITAYRPELTLTAVSAPAEAAGGEPLSVTHTTRNLGTARTAGAFTIWLYLSADATLDEGDVPLGTRTITVALAAGAARTDITTVIVPAGTLVPDPYYVIGVVDALEQQRESDEQNNVTASAAIVGSPMIEPDRVRSR